MASIAAAALFGCPTPPPRIDAIPPSGLALRLHVFGASAQEARRAFEAVRANNKSFSLVASGGDGEVVVGLENDSPKCVPPTSLCSYVLSLRIRNNEGEVVHSSTSNVLASGSRCSSLCEDALNNVAVKVVEAASSSLKPGPLDDGEGGVDGGVAMTDAASSSTTSSGTADAGKHPTAKKGAKQEAPKPTLCAVGTGPRLPSEEAERRAAQVEALKRMNVLDQAEYDCLRKAYLDRL